MQKNNLNSKESRKMIGKISKKSRWSQEENAIYQNYIARRVSESGEIDFDELKCLLPMKTKLQLYSKHQKMKRLVKYKKVPMFEPTVKTKVEILQNEIVSCLQENKSEKNKYINFVCSENEEVLSIDENFLKILISLNNNTESDTIIANIDENVFENIFTHISMDRLYKKFLNNCKEK